MLKKLDHTMDVEQIDQIIAYYIAFRNKLKEFKDKYKLAIEPYENKMSVLEGKALKFLDESGARTIRTDEGTAYVKNKDSATVGDPDRFIKYVKDHGEYELLDRRANLNAVRDFIKEHDKPPPGVNFSSMRVVRFMSPSQKEIDDE